MHGRVTIAHEGNDYNEKICFEMVVYLEVSLKVRVKTEAPHWHRE